MNTTLVWLGAEETLMALVWCSLVLSDSYVLKSFLTSCFVCSGIRVLDGPLTDSMEAVAFNKHYQINDVYSCRYNSEQLSLT